MSTSTEPRDLTERVRAEYARGFVSLYRACDLCDRGRTLNARRVCADAELSQPVPVNIARQPGQACGPDAERMTVAAWDL